MKMPAVQVSRNVPLPPTINTIEQHAPKIIEKQGIVTILGSNFQENQIPPSLRRTLSADMSSKNWLSQNGMSKMKRVSSSAEFATKVGDQEELKQNIPTHDDVWRSIQSQKEKGSIWSSILAEKKDNNIETSNQTSPYVHPLLRKSTSILSQKSLEICTESLGSETGSDGFSSNNPSEISDDKENENQEKIEHKIQCSEDFHVPKYNYNPSQKKVAQKKSFPPPLPSLSGRNDGCSSLQMQAHRKNGRLILEAVSVPQQNYFQINRQEGRLLLTLINNDPQEPNTPEKLEENVADFQEEFDHFEQFDVNEDETEEKEYKSSEYDQAEDEDEEKEDQMTEQSSSSLPTSGMINIPMMKSFLGMGKKDSLWSNKINKVVELMEAEQMVGKLVSIPQSLPTPAAAMARVIPLSSTTKPPPPPTGAPLASFNVYEYFWRRNNKTSIAGILDSSILKQQCSWNKLKDYNNDNNHQQEVVIMRGNKGDYFVPLVCKENRRSLLFWQPHCIATS
ncbi:hypothetical protein Leryth_014773 [Lithospermum erythrorhizon]|nr:hypothetical protein Leryth_014773 [Lithospermum erythrorhizon]